MSLISGLSRSAKSGVLVKDGSTLEQIARVSTAILDKTGSLTHRSEVVEIRAVNGFSDDELPRLAARLEQASGYILAAAPIKAARAKGLSLSPPEAAREVPGTRVERQVEGHQVVVWGSSYVRARSAGLDLHTLREDSRRGCPLLR